MPPSLQAQGDSLTASLVLASDVHIQHMADRRGRLLLDLIERLSSEVEVLVLNGDIFDFCFGDAAYYRRKFRPLGEALEAAAKRGIRVVFVEGNHEVHMDRSGWSGVEFVLARDFALTLRSGERIKISHGDLITEDPLYRAFRGLIKSQFARRAASYIPGGWLDAYSLRHAKISRSQDRYRTLNHQRILDAFRAWVDEGAFDHGIIGHFHVPYAEPRQGRPGLLLSVDSWDRPNALIYRDGQFQRVHLQEPGLPFIAEPVASLFS